MDLHHTEKAKERNINLKAVTTIDPITGWSEITQYNDKIEIPITKLVETTWLSRYPRPMYITYDQGSEFIGHEYRKYLIEIEYRITSKPITLGNPTLNAILERIHQVLGKLVRTCNITQTYDDKYDPWLRILVAEGFEICSTKNRLK